MTTIDQAKQAIEEMAELIAKIPPIEYTAGERAQGRHIFTSRHIARYLYKHGYRKQSEVIEEYRQKVNTKMGKHTHLLGKEYVQRILREVAKEMKGGAE